MTAKNYIESLEEIVHDDEMPGEVRDRAFVALLVARGEVPVDFTLEDLREQGYEELNPVPDAPAGMAFAYLTLIALIIAILIWGFR